MKPREKVSLQEFSIDTTLSPEAIREAGQRAAEAGTRFTTSTVVEHEVAGPIISYAIKGPGGSETQMELTVLWKELGDGQRRVSMEVGEFMTDQIRIAFVPIWPKSVTAMGSLKRFAASLRKELL